MNVKLNDGSQVCVKLDNFKIEGELEPLLWTSEIEDKFGKRIEQSLQLAVPKILLHNKDPTKLFCFVEVSELEAIKKNHLICDGKKNCFEKATTSGSVPVFAKRRQDRPAVVENLMCIPLCGNAVCDIDARRQCESLMKGVSKDCRKFGIRGKMLKHRICNMCNNVSSRNGEYQKCSGCNVTFYCSKKCQLEDWKDHEQNCV